ncbi:MAG: 1-(5-phosphoribosyl)-5-[(5-phosphoribosylamino)methylideneamino]imidazole-4-carboxamide isomerase [Flavobacteriaceae bacterium]
MKIIPAIDIIDGKCVRLSQGDYATQKVYSEDPLEVAKEFENHGIQFLHLVDLDGAKAKQIINYKVLERLATHTNLHIDFGGGLKSDDDLRIAFECGAKQVTGGSIAVQEKTVFLRWLEVYGPDKIILGADARDEKIATSGWLETSDLELLPFLKDYVAHGIKQIICTDISKDGMLEGPSVVLYQKIRAAFPDLKLVASGGVSQLKDLEILAEIGCHAAIVGKALYENRITFKDLTRFIS